MTITENVIVAHKTKKVGAVMVVGGGISGMQSALDLANAGFKVYLIEEGSAIGGRMAKLDKTFPTNDCSMCMISPKLIEVDKHPNIELINDAKVEGISGEAGNFTVRVVHKPRYIDLTKCTGCGECIDACPVVLKNEYEQNLNTRKAVYKSYPQAIPNAVAISKANRPPCILTCPASCNGQGYSALIGQGKYVEALDLIKQTIPLPATLGRICHHPCEQECNRAEIEEPLAIRPLKRFAADFVRQKRREGVYPPEAKPVINAAKPKIAVVGAGPSGLSCAFDLSRKGYPVTIFEANATPGGQLMTAIPQYRLPKDALADEIRDITDAAIELKLNSPIGDKLSLFDLKKQGYESIYLAVGAGKSRGLPIAGADAPGVLLALDFLKKANAGETIELGKRMVVIGGGNVAMDVARTARRLGVTEVTAVCLESRDIMPAHTWEITEAEEEGVIVKPSWGPSQILASNGKITGVEFKACTAVFDLNKVFNPTYDEQRVMSLDCDNVVFAIGQAVDLAFLPKDSGIKTTRGGWLLADPLTLATGEAGIFAGGDAVTGPKSAVEAIAQGHEAAISIERYLTGQDLKTGRGLPKQLPAPVPAGQYEKKVRLNMKQLSVEQRLAGFKEIEQCFTEEEARTEAKRCLNCGICSECMQCVVVCKAKAVVHDMKPEVMDIPVGSLILAPGFEPFDATIKGEYGYGRIPNVVTSMDFERILSASGPCGGSVLRPSDNKHPIKVAWIQCVGSRDETCGNDYCSSVCCMYATKEAIIAREHDNHIQPTIFYNDLRAFGKNFERYYESAKGTFGVRYINSIPSTVKELQQSHNLLVEFTDKGGSKTQEEFDMVVLSVGLRPSASAKEMADKLGVKLDRFGFCHTPELSPNTTSKSGIYVAGAFESPMDIPESLMSASCAAALAAENVAEARGTLETPVIYPPEVSLDGQEPRIGVFICRCGTNIARVVDVPATAEYAKTLPYVVYAEENMYTCSSDTQRKITDRIQESKLNRVVVASCSPRTHEPLFQNAIREAGLNKYLFEMANIRDQCSWVHATHIPEANVKAKDLVRMAIARAATLRPLHETRSDVKQRALVIGGGLGGMTAALGIVAQGYDAILVEKEQEMGGNLKHIYYTVEGANPQVLLADLVRRVRDEPRIKLYLSAEIKSISGFIGNFKTEISTAVGKTEIVDHGVVILATGAAEYKPVEYLYGQSDKVMTQSELEENIAKGNKIDNIKSAVMIQCVGSREKDHMYCSRICCTHAVKNAIKLKELNPDMEIYVLYRDIRTYGMHELKYREARDKGIVFIRFDTDRKPEVTQVNGKLSLKVYDMAIGEEVGITVDILVLSSAIRPRSDTEEFAARLKLPLTQDKFYMEAHMKLRPLDFTNEGMYLCGLAHNPKNIAETTVQAKGAVARAVTVLSKPYLMVGGVVSVVDPNRCVACLTCVRACPFSVPKVGADFVVHIEPAACQGCGICASACPRQAIQLQNYSPDQIDAKSAVLCLT